MFWLILACIISCFLIILSDSFFTGTDFASGLECPPSECAALREEWLLRAWYCATLLFGVLSR